MSIGGGGGGSSSASTTTNPWSQIAAQLAGTLKDSLGKLASGGNLSDWIKTLTASSAQATKSGTANIRESFAGSGLAHSTDLAKSIGDFQVQQTTALNAAISGAEQTNIQDQLMALQEIISLASGTSKTSGSSSQWGIDFSLGLKK
jgi:hypothetical protein